MARSSGVQVYNTFVRGLITEANGLTFPENASLEEENFILNRDGSRQRRLGMNYEEGFVFKTQSGVDISRGAFNTFLWRNASSSVDILVVQVGQYLWFYDALAATTSGGFIKSVTMTPISSHTSTTIARNRCSFASHKGLLFVAQKGVKPFYVQFNEASPLTSSTFSVTSLDLKERDFEGVNDTLAIDARPTTLSDLHKYNLKNQGWGYNVALDTGSTGDPIQRTFDAKGYYPSNADLWYAAKDTNNQYEPDNLEKLSLGTSYSAKGYYIFDAFYRDYGSVAGVGGLGTITESNRPEAVEAHAGRIFWSGVNSSISKTGGNIPDLNNLNKIWFSPTIEKASSLGNCYQRQDPTSEDLNDVLATDGGTIEIAGAGRIIRLMSLKSTLLVFATNGVWAISGGGEGEAFSATSHQVNRLSNIGAIGVDSIVLAEDTIFYFSTGGIYALASDELGGVKAQNITTSSIQSFFNKIPQNARATAYGFYDEIQKKVRWLYDQDDDASLTLDRYKYGSELVLDVVLQAFYVNKIAPHAAARIVGAARVRSVNATEEHILVVASGHQVVAGGKIVGTEQTLFETRIEGQYKYVVIEPSNSGLKLTFASYRDISFRDWASATGGGSYFQSFLRTGYDAFGDATKKKQVNYILFYFKPTEQGTGQILNNPSSCFVRSKWDWAIASSTGQWGTKMQAYRLPKQHPNNVNTGQYGYDVIVTKNKMRGSGRALSLHIESEDGKDMHLLGWGLSASMQGSV